MEYSNCNRKYHLGVEAHNGALDHKLLDSLGNPGLVRQGDTEERTQDETNHEGYESQEEYQFVVLVESHIQDVVLLEVEAQQHQYYSVSGVSHTEGEEQQVERTQDCRKVELIVNRHSVHSGECLEQ